jgi:hypothetical protein
MTNSPFPLWTAAASDAAFTPPEACAAHASAFERRIARRNRRELAAGLIQLPFWGGLAGFFLWEREWLVGFALLLCGAGVLVVLRNLARRAGTLAPQPEEPCLAHLERQYRRQLDALESVPAWYIGPLVPGVLALFAGVTAGVAESRGWIAALEGVLWPFTGTFGLFAIVILLNRVAARSLAAELARLKALA